MALQVTELTFLEQLAHRFDLPVPDHLGADASRADIREAMRMWKKGVVKSDIMIGGRGKAGLVSIVDNPPDALKELKRLSAGEAKGHQARSAYITQFIPGDLQIYTAITYDSRYLGPSLTVSLEGGVDVESVGDELKRTIPVDVFKGLDAYQAADVLTELGCPTDVISIMARTLVQFWDMFISGGFRMCEVNPWRIGPNGRPYACDFKAILDESNFKKKSPDLRLPEYPENVSEFEEEMNAWNLSSYQGQAHVSELDGKLVLPVLFGGGASTIAIETLELCDGSPIFLSDFGGNPPYERMFGTAERCFRYHLKDAAVLLILGGKANNTLIDVTLQAIADALAAYVAENGPITTPVVLGRGGPRMVPGFIAFKETMESLGIPYVMFGHDTPMTLVAEYAAKLALFVSSDKEVTDAS